VDVVLPELHYAFLIVLMCEEGLQKYPAFLAEGMHTTSVMGKWLRFQSPTVHKE
jgi:hypothetical protein